MSSASGGTIGKLKALVVVLAVSAVVAAVLTWIVGTLGLLAGVPETELASVGVTLSPAWVVGVVCFVLVAFAGVLYAFFGDQITEKAGQTREQWADLPVAAKALIAGLPFALATAASVALTNAMSFPLPAAARIGVPVVVWLGVTVGCYAHVNRGGELRWLLRTLVTGSVVGAAFAIGSVLLDRLLDGLALPGYVPLAVLLGGATVVSLVMIQSARRDGPGLLGAVLVRTGFAQVRQLQTLTVALAIGLFVAAVVALLVSLSVGGLLPTVLAFLVGWLLATYVALRWFRRTSVAHSDLVIVDVRERSSGSRRELAVTNERETRVDLRNAKIRDTEYDLYRTNIEVILAPGQTETFDIPPDFSLFPATDDLGVDLPMGFSVSKTADAPVIVTRDGEKFKLRWGDGVGPHAGRPQGQGGHPQGGAGGHPQGQAGGQPGSQPGGQRGGQPGGQRQQGNRPTDADPNDQR